MKDEEIVAKSNNRVIIISIIFITSAILGVFLGYYIHWLLGLSLLLSGLYIHHLYGFYSKEELEVFKRLEE